MAKDAYYFSHDSNARTDPKILAMFSDYGVAGYGRWWILIEILREHENYMIKHSKCTWKALAMQMQYSADEVQKFINDCINEYELLKEIKKNNDTYFYSESLMRRMGKLDDIKEKRVLAANARWKNKKENMQNDANELEMQCNSMQSKPTYLPSKPTKEINKNISEKFSDDSIQIILAKKLHELILVNDPKAKEPNLQNWAKDIDKMIRIDNRSTEEIESLIKFAQSNNFWKANILSANKLREKATTLLIQMKEVKHNGANRTGYVTEVLESKLRNVTNL